MNESVNKALEALRNPRSIFYGWWIVLVGTIGTMMYSAVLGIGVGAYLLPIARQFGSGRMAVAGVYSLVRVESGLLGPIQGYMLDRWGPRAVMRVGYIVAGLGFILLSRANSLPVFYAFFAVTAIGASLSGFLAVATTVVNWFYRRRGLCLAIIMMGTSLGGVLVPVLTWSIESFGWRPTFVGIGVFFWVAGIPITSVMRQRPEQYGTLPDGDIPPPRPGGGIREGRPGQAPAGEWNFTVGEAVRTRAFWLLGFAHALSLMVWSSVVVHGIPALTEIGVSETVAATALSVTAGLMAFGRLAGGFLGDRLGRKPALLICYVVQSAGLVVLASVQALWQAYIFAVLTGLGFGARGPLLIALRGDYFGRRAFATISGTMELLLATGSIIAPLYTGYIYDLKGSYTIAFLSIAGASLAGGLLVLALQAPVPRK